MPIFSNTIAKIVILSIFVLTTALKVSSIVVLSAAAETICLYGWHVSEEAAKHLLLVTISLIPDIIMIVCISVGIIFKSCNIGADPGTIIYNFLVGLLTISAMIPFLGVENCKSDNLPKIKSVGIFATIAGVLHIAGSVLGFISLAPEERSPPERHN